MWVPLVVLAVLATIGGLVGVGPAFHAVTGSERPFGRLNISTWLDPVIWNSTTHGWGGAAEEGDPSSTEAGVSRAASGVVHEPEAGAANDALIPKQHANVGFNLAEASASALGSHTAAEWLFIFISLGAAGFGMFMGWLFYLKNPSLPDVWAKRLAPLYSLSYHKYWVDELYGVLFTRRTMDAARVVYAFDSKILDGAVNGVAWLGRFCSLIVGAFDKYVVDGIVNAVASFIGELMSRVVRTAQTGFAPNYALVMVLGLVIAVAMFFSGDILSAIRAALALHF
jgi:NADH:ubiquinone oxidoreductase subunit 5 (subunit L)/multisubunit Na+/H+ antiporter MnhA subunit